MHIVIKLLQKDKLSTHRRAEERAGSDMTSRMLLGTVRHGTSIALMRAPCSNNQASSWISLFILASTSYGCLPG